MINQFEKETEFTPEGLKKEIDASIADLSGWKLRKSTDLIKVWGKYAGTNVNGDIPAIRCEHYFPRIDDPTIILKALTDLREEWDESMIVMQELTQFRNNNTHVQRLVNKSVIGLQPREFIDKKFFFTDELGTIYIWVTSAPDSVYPIKK